MTAYRDRLEAGVYDPKADKAKAEKAATKKTAARRKGSTTSKNLKGLGA